MAGAGTGDVAVVIVDPQGRRDTVEVALEDKGDSTFRCTYRPVMEGPHMVHVAFAGAPITRSPFPVHVAEGEGLSPAPTVTSRKPGELSPSSPSEDLWETERSMQGWVGSRLKASEGQEEQPGERPRRDGTLITLQPPSPRRVRRPRRKIKGEATGST